MGEVKSFDSNDRARTRERLRQEKPLVYEKLCRLDERTAAGEEPPPVIEIAYRYDCNLRCKHCFASRFEKKERMLMPEDLRALAAQANEMGVYQVILQGGEPIFWRDFDDVVAAINPKDFYMGLVTNASLLNEEKVRQLREMGIDKIVISLDSYDAAQYEENRKRTGLFSHTVEMLFKARDAGLRVVINTVATKQNVREPHLLKLIDFVKENGFIVYVNFATPIGEWEGRYDLLLDKEDADYIYDLNLRHEVVKRDLFPYKGVRVSCPAFRSVVYITQYGDVLPCPFIHISAGNILDEPLPEIIRRGMSIKQFKDRPQVCLASEDRDFIFTKIAKTFGRPTPVSMYEIFTEEEIGK